MSLRSPIFDSDDFAVVQYVLDDEARVTLEFRGPAFRFEASNDRVEVSMPHAVWEEIRRHAPRYSPGDWADTPITPEEEAEWARRRAEADARWAAMTPEERANVERIRRGGV